LTARQAPFHLGSKAITRSCHVLKGDESVITPLLGARGGETEQLDRELDDEAVSYRPRPPIARKLDPYRGIIQARLQAYPRLTAERIFEEIRAAGYAGGYTQIKEYVRKIRPRSIEEAVRRFETPAGFQGQVDYAPPCREMSKLAPTCSFEILPSISLSS
jgi:hypothetical protein